MWFFKPTGNADFSVSENGVLTYRTGTGVSRLTWFDRRGGEIGSLGMPDDYGAPRISPDGRSAALNMVEPRTGTTNIWTYDLSRGFATRFTVAPRMENDPIWSPDGSRIVFAADIGGPPHLYQKAVNETGSGEMLVPSSGWVQVPWDWAPDGRFIIYGDAEAQPGNDLMILPLESGSKPRPFLDTQFNESGARFSPDGRWVAPVSDESGRSEIYVCPLENCRRVRQRISTAGGASPAWRRDGKELFYIASDKRLMAVPVRVGVTFDAGTPVARK